MIARLHDVGAKSAQSITGRKYLIGAVLGWVLVVYLVAGPSLPSAAPLLPAFPVPGAHQATVAPVSAASDSSPSVAASPNLAFGSPSFGVPDLSFGPQPPPPAQPAPFSCPYPIPQSQTTPFDAGIFLSFEGPFIEMSGPFATYDIPTLGAIAPLVPMLTPLVYISEPVLNALTPNISTVVSDYLTIIDDAGLNSPQEQQYANEFEPYYLELLGSLSPVETELASSTAGQCLVLFENELAVMDSQQNVSVPSLPEIPPGIPPGSSSQADAVETAEVGSGSSPFAQLVLPWSSGVPAELATAESALGAKSHPVELDLVDDPPAGQQVGGAGFADFVAEAVHASPQASAFEVDGPGTDPAGAAEIGDLVHGLAAADMERLPGQVIGMGVPDSAQGTGSRPFWTAFDAAMKGWQPAMVDFVAADLTPQALATPEADESEAVSTLRSLQAMFSSAGGVPTDVSVFGTVALAGSAVTSSEVQQQIAGYLRALHAMHLGMLGVLASN